MEYECLICCGNDGKLLYKVCNCNSYIHLECFEKMINTVPSHNTHCAVCQKKYSIKKTLTGCVFSDINNSYFLILFDFLFLIFLIFSIYMIYFYKNRTPTYYALLISLFALFGSTVSAMWVFVRYLYYIRRKTLCCIRPVWKRSAMTFKNKNPKIVYFV